MKVSIFKKVLLIVFLAIVNFSFSQDQKNQRVVNPGDFHMIKVYSGVVLELIRSDEQKIVILGEKRENLSIKNTNGKLKVYLKFPELYNDKEVIIKLYYNRDLQIVDANEGAGISSNQLFTQKNAIIRAQEGAYIHLNVDVEYLTAKTVTGAVIRLRGKVLNQEVDATTGSIYEAYELVSESAEVMSASGAKAEVNVSDRLEANIRFGGIIHYKGNPERVKKSKMIGGRIINKGE